MVIPLKKVSGGIVVLLIGIIVSILYLTGEHHIPALLSIVVGIVVILLQRKDMS